ncbi:biotin--[acetyl-CoA-carboxylase] ligase [Seohaeicola zhoushanensis]|uniref:biotin--[biotin carboxyl-carrier protein] ligase n=1 Tax=Seohaeicola zhoushanensis TaxID=1569283 RepID=A0A8J3GW72_9RHOB|nr:biotin--[acetyl-CoA-carboxylase] ligase [Seohaeicola zhoushanensis]GHF47272.1 biotin--[acetyl-CoA-carboxylase] ligase [Seohaeicola zhoushanensis]
MSASWPKGYGLKVLDVVDSTLDEAARMAPQLAGPVWILAKEQTAARGRRGRVWVQPNGNFAATLVMRMTERPDVAALRSFVAALALFDAVAEVTGRAQGLALKWPNDVLLNGGKLAGILLESAGTGQNPGHLSIGIGVNLAEAPGASEVEAGAVRPVSLLSETGTSISPEDFLPHLAAAYATRDLQFTTYGFAPIRAAWLDRAARLGETITAKTGAQITTGRFETVDTQGNLVLVTPEGRKAIAAAEVYF